MRGEGDDKVTITSGFWQDWGEWFKGRWNWRNFTFIELSIEHTPKRTYGPFAELEIMFGLLGFCGRIAITHSHDKPLVPGDGGAKESV